MISVKSTGMNSDKSSKATVRAIKTELKHVEKQKKMEHG